MLLTFDELFEFNWSGTGYWVGCLTCLVTCHTNQKFVDLVVWWMPISARMFHSLKAAQVLSWWRWFQSRANTHRPDTSQISVSRAFNSFHLLKAPAVNSSTLRINLFSNKITKNENKQILPISPDTKASTLKKIRYMMMIKRNHLAKDFVTEKRIRRANTEARARIRQSRHFR